MYKFFFLFSSYFIWILPAISQVVNDDIDKRLTLQLNSSRQSNTTNCTVQWTCVNTKAVQGCIKFHNDQWFEFTTQVAGQYYLSITGQQCRDVRGVQVMVVDGMPCDPDAYQHLICHSTGAQDDIALILNNLQASHTYLINVDGYLNDFCQFTISVSTQPPAFTLFPTLVEVPVTSQIADSLVHLQWTLPDSLQEDFTAFSIIRRQASEKKSKEITRFAAETNAYGTRQTSYTYTDTVAVKGMYTYKIVGINSQQQSFLVKELDLYYDGRKRILSNFENLLMLEIPVRRKLNLRVLIFDAQTNELLTEGYMMTSVKKKNQLTVDVSKFIAAGIRRYRIQVQEVDNPKGYTKSFLLIK